MNAGFTLSMDTVTGCPLIDKVNVFSVRLITLCGPLYGGSRGRRTAS